MKVCKTCQIEKNEEEFYRSQAYKDGRCSKCKDCVRLYDQSMIARVKEKPIPLKKKCCRCKLEKDNVEFHKRPRNSDGLRSECIECTRSQEKEYRTRNPHQDYLRKIRQKYNLSPEEHSVLLAECEGKCLICQDAKKLVIDHSHKTGKIRGIICSRCNAGLGMFGDNIELFKKAIKYLEDNNE